jgi:hypothetical protein
LRLALALLSAIDSILTRPPIDKFPSSAAFDAINDALKSEADKKDAIKQGNAIFAFNIKNSAGETESWYIDLKTKGEVFQGVPEKPTGEFSLNNKPLRRPKY